MASSSIEWTEATWNPVTGCDRTSPGCDNCYALTLARRLKAMGQPKYQNDGDPRTSGPGFGITCHEQDLDLPLRWRGERRVFVNSMSDLFHPEVPDDFIAKVFAVMALADQHTFQMLTKRPQRMAKLLARDDFVRQVATALREREDVELVWPIPNLWVGTSIENDRYTWRADRLRDTPAAVRFLSLEPLIDDVPSLSFARIDWAIVGGESGHHARPMRLRWVRELRKRSRAAGTAFFVKQLGTVWSVDRGHGRSHGTDWTLWPRDLQVREYPEELTLAAV
jgi:protein gp37